MDPLLRTVRSKPGLEIEQMAQRATVQLLKRHPALYPSSSNQQRAAITYDGIRFLEHLYLAMEQQAPVLFTDYLCWMGRLLTARGISRTSLIEHMEVLRDILHQNSALDSLEQLNAIIDEGITALHEATVETSQPLQLNERVRKTGEQYFQTILLGNRNEALDLIKQAFQEGLTAKEIYLDILQPIMYEIGRHWERNEITVAQEHRATAITQYVMAHIYAYLFQTNHGKEKGSLIMTGVAGELHELGARIVSDFLEANGWDVSYLGTNMPSDSILTTLTFNPPQIVGISVTMSFNLRAAIELIDRIRAITDLMDTKIIVGGAAFRSNQVLWRTIKADGWAMDAEQALQVVENLTA